MTPRRNPARRPALHPPQKVWFPRDDKNQCEQRLHALARDHAFPGLKHRGEKSSLLPPVVDDGRRRGTSRCSTRIAAALEMFAALGALAELLRLADERLEVGRPSSLIAYLPTKGGFGEEVDVESAARAMRELGPSGDRRGHRASSFRPGARGTHRLYDEQAQRTGTAEGDSPGRRLHTRAGEGPPNAAPLGGMRAAVTARRALVDANVGVRDAVLRPPLRARAQPLPASRSELPSAWTR